MSRSYRKVVNHRFVESLESRRLLAAGDLDTAFGGAGKAAATYTGSADDSGDAVVVQSDGKVLVGGNMWYGDSFITLSRYLANGQPDASFGAGGTVQETAFAWRSILDIALTSDGSILALNSGTSPSGIIQRFTTSGAADPTWVGPDATLTGTPQAMMPLSDGKTLIATTSYLARLQLDGSLDSTFGAGGKVALPIAQYPNLISYPPYSMAVQSDGGILLAGEQYKPSTGVRQAMVRRYSSAGVLDTTFASGTGTLLLPVSTTNSSLRAIQIQTDGKVLVGGYSVNDSIVARFSATGVMDSGFGVGGIRTVAASTTQTDKIYRMVLGTGNVIYVGGYVDNVGPFLGRLTSGGVIDSTYDGNGIVEFPLPSSWPVFGGANIALSGGQVVMTTSAAPSLNQSWDRVLSRYTTSGAIDTTFGTASGITRNNGTYQQSIYTGRSTIQPDGKLIQIGVSHYVPGNAVVLRWNADGTPDTTFGVNGFVEIDAGARQEWAKDVLVQPDGKIVVVGRADFLNGPAATATWDQRFFITRLNSNGSLDTSFAVNGVNTIKFPNQFYGELNHVALLSDGRIVASGYYAPNGGSSTAAVLRFSASGALDFNYGGGAGMKTLDFPGDYETIISIAASGTGVLLAGDVATTSSNDDRFVVRLDDAGNFDSSFGAAGVAMLSTPATDDAVDLDVDPTAGAIYLAGTSASGLLLTKLSAAGIVDGSFGSGGTATVALGSTDIVADMQRTPTGNFVFAGTRTRSGSSDQDFLAMRLTPAGALDSTFGAGGSKTIDMGTTSDIGINVLLAPGGRMIIAGQRSGAITTDWAAAQLLEKTFAPLSVISRDFRFTPDTVIQLMFPGNVMSSLDASDLVAYNVSTGQRFSTWTFFKTLTDQGDSIGDWLLNSAMPEGQYVVTVPAGGIVSGTTPLGPFVFNLFTSPGTGADDAFAVKHSDASNLQITRTTAGAAPVTFALPYDPWTVVAIAGGAGNDSFTFDMTGGPLTSWVTADGGSGTNSVSVTAQSAADTFNVYSDTFSGSSLALGINSIANLSIATGTYTFVEDAANMSLDVKAATTAVFNVAQHFQSLTIAGTARIAAGGGNAKTLVTRALNFSGTGKLNLTDHALIVDYSSVSPVGTWTGSTYDGITGLVKSGRNGGAWTGNGIITTSASGNYTAVGVANASQALGISGTQTAVFAGRTVDVSSVLVKYTYGGDANLDGKINVDDYTRIDFNVPLGVNGWFNGDFNLDGKINVDDYTIVDFNVGIQGSPM